MIIGLKELTINMLTAGIVSEYKNSQEAWQEIKNMLKDSPSLQKSFEKEVKKNSVFKDFLQGFLDMSNEEKNECFKEAIKKANEFDKGVINK